MVAVMGEFTLNKMDWWGYKVLLTHSKQGNLDDVKSINLDTRITSYLSIYNFPSPFVEAAYYGHFDVLKYLLEKYGEHIDINCGAKLKIILDKHHKKIAYHIVPQHGLHHQLVNNVPLFLAACSNDNVEMLEYLMSKGADIMKEVPIWGNSLCVAAEYGCISAVKYLLDCATPVNYTNCKGNNPLLVACGSEVSNVDNSTAIIDLLISKGADLHHKSIEGYTAMHQAALSDKVRHVQTLLAHGMSPLFAQANPIDDNYIPCPLYVAARNSCNQTMEFLMTLPNCPNICKWEASLLYWQHGFKEWEMLENNFQYLQASNIKPIYLDAKISVAYGNYQEMSSKEDMEFFRTTADYTVRRYQIMLIQERIFGLHATNSVTSELKQILHQIKRGLYKEVEVLRQHVFEKCPKQVDLFLCHPLYEDTVTAITIFGWACDGTRLIVEALLYREFTVEHVFPYLKFLKDLLFKVQLYLTETHFIHVETILFLFYWTIRAIFDNGRNITLNNLPVQFLSLFKELVTDCLYIAESSLLQIFITKIDQYFPHNHDNSKQIPFISLMMQCLLLWGGDAIDQPNENDNGNRLLHKSTSLNNFCFRLPLTKILVSNGAHVDAVNALGSCFISGMMAVPKVDLFFPLRCVNSFNSPIRQFPDICSSYLPLPLSCLSASTIIAEGIPYKLVDLPKHVTDFIALHDPNNAMKKPYIDIDISSIDDVPIQILHTNTISSGGFY